MGTQRTAELTEQLELVPSDEPKTKKRAARENEIMAGLYAERLYPTPTEGAKDEYKRQRDGAYFTAIKHLSELCGSKAKNKGYKQYDYTEVYLAWEALYEKYLEEQDTGAWKHPPTLLGVAHGANPWIETWRDDIMQGLPAVYESFLHDSYVKKYAHVLRTFGFRYGATGQPNRLTREEVEELGLL